MTLEQEFDMRQYLDGLFEAQLLWEEIVKELRNYRRQLREQGD